MDKTIEPLERQEIRRLEDLSRKKIEKQFSALEKLEVEYVPIDSVFPNAYNPNRQSDREFELLKLSISEDGFTQPILVQRETNLIIDGEHRWRACYQLGFTTIPAVFVDMNQTQAYISTLRHNRARGSEDIELSIQILRDLRDLGALDQAVNSLGINEKELTMMLSDDTVPGQMANDEFSSAWIPTEANANPDAEVNLPTRHVSQSNSVMDYVRENDPLIEAAAEESLMEAGKLSKKMSGYIDRITVSLKSHLGEIQLVSKVLGERPAEMLLHLCCRKLLEHPETIPDYMQAKEYQDIFESHGKEGSSGSNS